MKKGRRPGNPQTREAILDAARTLFAKQGYDATTMRAIASAAGVDVALAGYYFGSKSDLFAASVELPISPATALGGVLVAAPDPHARAELLLRTLLTAWDSTGGGPLAALLRSATSQEQLLQGFMRRELLPLLRLAVTSDDEREASLRATAIASQVSGLLLVRYVLGLEPLASASHDEVVAVIGPTIERYLSGSL